MRIKQKRDEENQVEVTMMSSSKLANSSAKLNQSQTPPKPPQIDSKRVILTNIPDDINKEYLELYLEYLSNEIAVERYDFSNETENTLLVTFAKSIDFNRMSQKHLSRPNCLHKKTELDQVHLPSTILVEFDEKNNSNRSSLAIEEQFNKELFELYFSNRKRSGGENIVKCVYEANKSRALITYDEHEVAQRVASKSHQINNKPIKCSLFYEKFGKNPYHHIHPHSHLHRNHKQSLSISSTVTNSNSSSNVAVSSSSCSPAASSSSPYQSMSSSQSKTNLFKSSLLSTAEKKFDPKYLTAQQHSYLVELQSIYNELNGSNINIFKSVAQPSTHISQLPSPPHTSSSLPFSLTNKKALSLSKKSIFKSDLHISTESKQNKSKLCKEKSLSTNHLLQTEKTTIQKSNLLIEQQQQQHSSLRYRLKSTPENLRRKSLPEFNSTISLNLSLPLPTAQIDGHRSLGPSTLKKKTTSTQSLSNKTNVQHISLPPLPSSVPAPSATPAPAPAVISSLPLPTTIPRKSVTSSSTNLPSSSGHVVVVSTGKPVKPQKVIFKNKERPPPPKLVTMSAKSSTLPSESLATPSVNEKTLTLTSNNTNNNNSIRIHKVDQLNSSKELIRQKVDERADSMFSLKGNNQESNVTSTSDEQLGAGEAKARKSIVKNRSSVLKESNMLNTSSSISNSAFQQPKQTIIKFKDGISPGDNSDTENKENDRPNYPLCVKGVCSSTSNKLYKANLAKRNLQSFYGPTINESLNKLSSIQIEFIQSTRYLSKLKTLFPKVSINLNEKMRNLYFFGTSNQVVEAKSRVKYDLDMIKQTTYEIEQKELAEYLKKSEPRQKILKFIESIINRHQYHRSGAKSGSGKSKNLENGSMNFCSYQVGVSKRDSNKNLLVVSTNMENMAQFLHKLLNESIRVNQLINIYNTDIVDYIINGDSEWNNFYDLKFKNNVDFTLLPTKDSKDSAWSLKITGFKEYVDKFIIDFRNKFD